jgi:hypothetical protein
MKAWIENDTVRDIVAVDPNDVFHPDVAALYVTDVPEGCVVGATLVDGVWTNPPPPPVEIAPPPAPEPVRTVLSKLDYMNRFTDEELAGIYQAAKVSVAVEVWLEKFKLATDIDTTDPRTVAGCEALEAAGLLAPGRAAQILSGTPV